LKVSTFLLSLLIELRRIEFLTQRKFMLTLLIAFFCQKSIIRSVSALTTVPLRINRGHFITSKSFLSSMSKRKEEDNDGAKPEKKKRAPKKALLEVVEPPNLPFLVNDFNNTRARLLTTADTLQSGECVIYWMSRDQRAHDNHALTYAQVRFCNVIIWRY
jgi:hypothetical protein